MKERIFTLKAGTEVAKRFDGLTVPFTVPEGLAETLRVHGVSENAVAKFAQVEAGLDSIDRDKVHNAVAVHNQAHALNVQKYVKSDANDEKATNDSLRERAVGFKYDKVRERGGNGAGGATKVKAATVEKVLGQDLLASFTPEQRAMYEAQLAALRPAEAAPAAATPTPEKAPTNGGKQKQK